MKFYKKDEAREAKEANKAFVQEHLLKLCHLINNYDTGIANLTLSTHSLFGAQKLIIKYDKNRKG